jgi:hypothetical protein
MRYFVPLLLVVAFAPIFVSAQTSGIQGVIDSSVSLTITPSTPGPNQAVSAVLDSSSVDLDTAIITWSVNGKKMQSGQGEKTLSLTSGSVGSETIVSANIVSTDGGSLVESVTISPATVDLMWQGGGYVPPFYKGRTPWAGEGQITFLAIPNVLDENGNEIDPKTLIYKWTKDDTVLGESSGAGQNSLTLTDSILSLPETIEVDILTDRDTTVATQSVNLSPINPGLLVYEDNPLYGFLFNNEVGSQFTATEKEFSFVAFPLSFNAVTRDSQNLSYTWSSTGGNSQAGDEVTYQTPDSGSGSSQINVTVNSTSAITQSAQRNFLVQFGSQNNL